MSERIWGALRKNALYKSTYTYTLMDACSAVRSWPVPETHWGTSRRSTLPKRLIRPCCCQLHVIDGALPFNTARERVVRLAVELIGRDIRQPRSNIDPIGVALTSRRLLVAVQILRVHCKRTIRSPGLLQRSHVKQNWNKLAPYGDWWSTSTSQLSFVSCAKSRDKKN